MIRGISYFALAGMLVLSSCAKKESAEAPNPSPEVPAAAQPAGGPHALVYLKDGSKVPGTIVASSQTDMVVAGDDGIERKIPMAQIKSVEYSEAQPAQTAQQSAQQPAQQASREPARPKQQTAPRTAQQPAPQASGQTAQQATEQPVQQAAQPTAQPVEPAPPPPPAMVTETYELPVGSEVSVRMNETIDSETAKEGQTFGAQLTRDARDADGYVVIPRGSKAVVVIRSASKGGHFRGASDLVLDLSSVTINGRQYTIDTAEIGQKGKSGVGANKRTATYTGGGAVLGAIIGAIAGGGKGAAIGAGAGAGAGVLTQVVTKGGAIKVPVESVLTFKLDKPLKVTAAK